MGTQARHSGHAKLADLLLDRPLLANIYMNRFVNGTARRIAANRNVF
jgi:hypothetical protein